MDIVNLFMLKMVCISVYYMGFFICRAGDWARFEEGNSILAGNNRTLTVVVMSDIVPTAMCSVNGLELATSNSLHGWQCCSMQWKWERTRRQHQVSRRGEKGGWRDIAGSLCYESMDNETHIKWDDNLVQNWVGTMPEVVTCAAPLSCPSPTNKGRAEGGGRTDAG